MKSIASIVGGLFMITIIVIVDVSSSISRAHQSVMLNNLVAEERNLPAKPHNVGERIVDVDMHVRVRARRRDFLVSVTLSNREDVDLVMVPTFLSLEVTPLMRSWYPEDTRDFVMELIVDSMPPAETYLQHATSLLSLNDQPLQMILIARKRNVVVSYHVPYPNGFKRKQLRRLSVYRGVFNVPLYLAGDTKLSEIIKKCLLPLDMDGEYVAFYRNGVAVIADKSVDTRVPGQNEAALLSSSSETPRRLILKHIVIDSVIR